MMTRDQYMPRWVRAGTLKTIHTINDGTCVTCGGDIKRGDTVLYRTMCVYMAHPACGYPKEKGNFQ